MRSLVAVALLLSLGRAQTASPAEHLVGPPQVDTRLAEATRARAADLATVDAVLHSPEARRAAESLGVEIGSVEQAVARLSDAELRDLAVRVNGLQTDPAAGHTNVPIIPGWVPVVVLLIALGVVVGLAYGVQALVD